MSGWRPQQPMDNDATVVLPRPGGPPPYPPPPPARPSILPRLLRFGAWFNLGLAVCFLLIAGLFALSTSQFLERAAPVEGVVVRLAEQRDGNGSGVTYAPVFRFTGTDGRVTEITHFASSNPPMWSVGQRATLLQDRERPDYVVPDGFASIWLFPMAFAGAAVFALLFFGLMRFGARRLARG